jgi:hypothetical protein
MDLLLVTQDVREQRREIRMTSQDLESVAESLVADGKGNLAADKTAPILTKRFDTASSRLHKPDARIGKGSLHLLAPPSSSVAPSCTTTPFARRVQAARRPPRLLQAKGRVGK